MVGTPLHQPFPPGRFDFRSRLQDFAALALELEVPVLSAAAEVLAERIVEGRFYVACVGQFKRGKSTLLNALLGQDLLPTGVVPVTSVVTIVRYGAPHAVIQFGDRTEDAALAVLSAYVTEDANPENAKGVVAVAAFVPSPLLASGMCLVDTPGIGSVFRDNTEATKEFVPHIDAALVVLGADPPISADELALVGDITRETPELIVVLNKADRTSDRDRKEARRFCAQVLASRVGRPIGPILEISATAALSGHGPQRDWDALCARLTRLAERSGSHLVRAAEQRGLRVLVNRAVREIREREDALQRPIEESAQRIQRLRRCAAESERALGDLTYLLTAEQDRLSQRFADAEDSFLKRTLPAAHADLEDALHRLTGSRAIRWRESHRLAGETFHRFLTTWRAEQQPRAELLYRDATRRFTELVNTFLDRVASEGSLGAADVPEMLATEDRFRTPSRLFFTELMYQTSRSPLRWLVDAVRTPRSFDAAVAHDAHQYLEQVIVTNASRVSNDLREQVLESRRRLERDLRDVLREVYGVAERALQRAQAQRAQGADATRPELARLGTAIEDLCPQQPAEP
jgi:GTP-binding protein EngB required for normal cell division